MRKILHTKQSESGVTVIEMLIVVSVIGILSAIVVPSLSGFLNTSKRKSVVSDKGSLQSAVDGYRSANTNSIPIVRQAGDTTTTASNSMSLCFGPSAGGLSISAPKNNCFIDMAVLASAWFLSSPGFMKSASSDNVVGGTGLYTWVILASKTATSTPAVTPTPTVENVQ